MTEKFKPCPFCGGKALQTYAGTGFIVKCLKCGVEQEYFDTKKEAIIAWNSRPIESKMKRDNVKLMMTNKLLKKRVKRLELALRVIMNATKKDKPSLKGINLVAYMALKEEDNE